MENVINRCCQNLSNLFKNDASFLISDIMGVYERQSSYEPNIPLRMLAREYSEEEI